MNLKRRKRDYVKRKQIKQKNKSVKILVIPFCYTGAEPRTVVIESFYAIIAVIAMCASWWPDYPTGFAGFEQ